jgi:hypothetical protein
MLKVLRFLGVWAIVMLLVGAAGAAGFGDTEYVLTIHGTIAADAQGAGKAGYQARSIGFQGAAADTVHWVGVVSAQANEGDAFLGKDLLDRLDGFTPNMLAVGKEGLLAKLRGAPAGSRVVLNGILDTGSRTYLLNSVTVAPATGSH